MKLLIIDNFDSFTYNLFHYVEQFIKNVDVIRYNTNLVEQVSEYDKVIISPGPGLPSDYPILHQVITEHASNKNILGICLGMQVIGETFGCKLKNLRKVNHGVGRLTYIIDEKAPLFKEIPRTFISARYHSWVIDELEIPEHLFVTAIDDDNHIMALRHTKYNISGVQFHPESILTDHGLKMLENWLKE